MAMPIWVVIFPSRTFSLLGFLGCFVVGVVIRTPSKGCGVYLATPGSCGAPRGQTRPPDDLKIGSPAFPAGLASIDSHLPRAADTARTPYRRSARDCWHGRGSADPCGRVPSFVCNTCTW